MPNPSSLFTQKTNLSKLLDWLRLTSLIAPFPKMAILNKAEGCVVLRIVYAGAPLSGKTESLRSLSHLLFGDLRVGEGLYSPDHTDGRTLYFDWLNYTGGYFRGYKVNCQLISVPGQKTLQSRRQFLLEMADVVVFVVDSEESKLDTALGYYHEMLPWLDRQDEPPVGVVIQANKRDSATAVPMPTLYEIFQDNPNLLAIETIATQNSGIRETFVSSVRIGLERASWLLDHDRMAIGSPDLSSGAALLERIKTQEASVRNAIRQNTAQENLPTEPLIQQPEPANLELSTTQLGQLIHKDLNKAKATPEPAVAEGQPDTLKKPLSAEIWRANDAAFLHYASPIEPVQAAETVNQAPDENSTATDTTAHPEPFPQNEQSPPTAGNSDLQTSTAEKTAPNLPHKDVIAGSVYPPISGRVILHKLADEEMAALEQTADNAWEARFGSQWLLLSRHEDSFTNSTDARMHLLRYANTHKKLAHLLSEHRCMAIAEAEQHKPWRVWQIVRNEPNLEGLLVAALMDYSPQRIAGKVYIIAEKFMEAHRQFTESATGLPLELRHISIHQNKPVFTGYLPYPAPEAPLVPALDALKQAFQHPISLALQKNPALSIGVPYVLQPLEVYAKNKAETKAMVDVLRRLFIGEH